MAKTACKPNRGGDCVERPTGVCGPARVWIGPGGGCRGSPTSAPQAKFWPAGLPKPRFSFKNSLEVASKVLIRKRRNREREIGSKRRTRLFSRRRPPLWPALDPAGRLLQPTSLQPCSGAFGSHDSPRAAVVRVARCVRRMRSPRPPPFTAWSARQRSLPPRSGGLWCGLSVLFLG